MHSEVPPPTAAEQTWPPRVGRSFFLLWVAGLFVQMVLMRVVWLAASGGQPTSKTDVRWVMLPIAIAGHAWQAWLLFGRRPRSIPWSLVPIISLFAPNSLRWIQLTGVIAPLLESALLAGVRLRPWAWILAGMAQVIAMMGSTAVASAVIAVLDFRRFGITPSLMMSGASGGLWLLCETGVAFVLAYWMPPLNSAPSTVPPLPPESKAG